MNSRKMRLTIELSYNDAAMVWAARTWCGAGAIQCSIEEAVMLLVQDRAERYRVAFPWTVAAAEAKFKEAHAKEI